MPYQRMPSSRPRSCAWRPKTNGDNWSTKTRWCMQSPGRKAQVAPMFEAHDAALLPQPAQSFTNSTLLRNLRGVAALGKGLQWIRRKSHLLTRRFQQRRHVRVEGFLQAGFSFHQIVDILGVCEACAIDTKRLSVGDLNLHDGLDHRWNFWLRIVALVHHVSHR